MTVIARFLALLELFREGAVAFDQVQPLGRADRAVDGSDEGELDVHDEFDEDDERDPTSEDQRRRSRSPGPHRARTRDSTETDVTDETGDQLSGTDQS